MIRWKKRGALRDWMAKPAVAIPLTTLTIFFFGYLVAFAITQGLSISALAAALINVGALAVSAMAAATTLRAVNPARFHPVVQVPLHIFAAVAFAFLWYFVALAGFALTGNWIREGLAARAFSENALVWQIFQGITLYVMIMLILDRISVAMELDNASPKKDADSNPKGTLLLRDQGEIVALDHDEIVRLSGAGDYVQVATAVRTFMSTRALTSFARSLPPEFLRVHRSHIVRYGAIARAEPAGNGRLTLHLKDGAAITTSRSGARLIRNLAA